MDSQRKRSVEFSKVKGAANSRGHDMGNVVNVSTFASGRKCVLSRCRQCGSHIFIEFEQHNGMAWVSGPAILQDCAS